MCDVQVAFIDCNRDLYIANVMRPDDVLKVASVVDSAVWNDACDMLATITDNALVTPVLPSSEQKLVH